MVIIFEGKAILASNILYIERQDFREGTKILIHLKGKENKSVVLQHTDFDIAVKAWKTALFVESNA